MGVILNAVSPKGVDPRAIKAMAQVGIDISRQRSKDSRELLSLDFDFVVTLCDNAREVCPYFPARTRGMHRGFDGPPKLAGDAGMKRRPWFSLSSRG